MRDVQGQGLFKFGEQRLGFCRLVSATFEFGDPLGLLRDVPRALSDVVFGLDQVSLGHGPVHATRIATERATFMIYIKNRSTANRGLPAGRAAAGAPVRRLRGAGSPLSGSGKRRGRMPLRRGRTAAAAMTRARPRVLR